MGMVSTAEVHGLRRYLYTSWHFCIPNYKLSRRTTETQYICSAQITPPLRTLLNVSPRFSPDFMMEYL